MVVKKHKLDGDHQKQVDLMALANYYKLLNEQQGEHQKTPDVMKNCQDILKCLARTTGTQEQLWQLLQPVEEFLLRVVTNVHYHIRCQIIIAILDKFYAYISDHQAVIYPPIAGILVVFEGADDETINFAAKWIVKQRKDEPNHRLALSRLYLWMCNWHGTLALGSWVLAYIKALEESEQFDVLIDASLEHLDSLLLAIGGHFVMLRRTYADVILHILASLRESAEAFDKISRHIDGVLLYLATNSGQFSREILQKLVDILTSMVDHMRKNASARKEQDEFNVKYADVINCLELHISSKTSSFLPPWRIKNGRRETSYQSPNNALTLPTIRVGLVNLGNTCYMNSVLQALFAARKFSVYVMMNTDIGDYGTKIGELFAKMLFGESPSVSPIELYESLEMSAFRGNQQHDSSEFLSHFFDKLRFNIWHTRDDDDMSQSDSSQQSFQDDVASGSRKRKSDASDNHPRPKRLRWDNPRTKFVEDMFGGMQVARVDCNHCQHYKITRDVFCELHLSYPEKLMDKTHSVQSLLDFYWTTERMTGDNRYQCPDCRQLRDADRSLCVDHHPMHLVLVLKNFEYDAKNSIHSKLMHNVVCDLNIVMPAVRNQKESTYSLFAAVIHDGINIDSGHYFTVAKDQSGWHKCDDSYVTAFDEKLLNNLGYACTPYILFYKRSDVEDEPLPTLDQLPQQFQDAVKTHNKFYKTQR